MNFTKTKCRTCGAECVSLPALDLPDCNACTIRRMRLDLENAVEDFWSYQSAVRGTLWEGGKVAQL